jgi:hypothetical protein
MSREKILMVLGVLVFISPWSGLPLSWLLWILSVIGLAVVAIGFTLRTRTRAELPPPPAPPQPPSPPHHDLSVPPKNEPPSRSSHIAFS